MFNKYGAYNYLQTFKMLQDYKDACSWDVYVTLEEAGKTIINQNTRPDVVTYDSISK